MKSRNLKYALKDLILTLLLVGGVGYLGFHTGSEPAYAFPKIEPQSYTIQNGHHALEGVKVNDDTTYSGMRDKDLHNKPSVRFLNNLYSHPIVHGVLSLTTGHNLNFSFDSSSTYDPKNKADQGVVHNPLASRGLVSTKGVPINTMLKHKKYLHRHIYQNGWKLETRLTRGKHNKTVKLNVRK